MPWLNVIALHNETTRSKVGPEIYKQVIFSFVGNAFAPPHGQTQQKLLTDARILGGDGAANKKLHRATRRSINLASVRMGYGGIALWENCPG